VPHTDPEEDKQYRREYLQRPEVKARRKQWSKEYNQRPEVKEKIKSPEVRAKRSAQQSIYVRIPEVKAKRAQRNLDSLRETYGWSPERFKEAMRSQGNACAICLELFKESPQADHEHSDPPKPRGLLCKSCNWALGHLKDDVKIVEAALEYLKYWGLPKENQ